MLAPVTNTSALNNNMPQSRERAEAGKVLRHVKNARMGGTVPVWETVKTAKDGVEYTLSRAGQTGRKSPGTALAYRAGGGHSPGGAARPFGFADLLDMINPLHHIPVVGHIYRRLSGDEIRPIGQIIGGAVFGGPAGAAGGLVNTIFRAETGRGMAENAAALAGTGRTASYAKVSENTPPPEHKNAGDDLPASLLVFADTDTGAKAGG